MKNQTRNRVVHGDEMVTNKVNLTNKIKCLEIWFSCFSSGNSHHKAIIFLSWNWGCGLEIFVLYSLRTELKKRIFHKSLQQEERKDCPESKFPLQLYKQTMIYKPTYVTKSIFTKPP